MPTIEKLIDLSIKQNISFIDPKTVYSIAQICPVCNLPMNPIVYIISTPICRCGVKSTQETYFKRTRAGEKNEKREAWEDL